MQQSLAIEKVKYTLLTPDLHIKLEKIKEVCKNGKILFIIIKSFLGEGFLKHHLEKKETVFN
jgi:hypothetical protein